MSLGPIRGINYIRYMCESHSVDLIHVVYKKKLLLETTQERHVLNERQQQSMLLLSEDYL